jgi:hypothetical protein
MKLRLIMTSTTSIVNLKHLIRLFLLLRYKHLLEGIWLERGFKELKRILDLGLELTKCTMMEFKTTITLMLLISENNLVILTMVTCLNHLEREKADR